MSRKKIVRTHKRGINGLELIEEALEDYREAREKKRKAWIVLEQKRKTVLQILEHLRQEIQYVKRFSK